MNIFILLSVCAPPALGTPIFGLGIAGGLVKSKNSESQQTSFIASPILPSYESPQSSYQTPPSSYQSPQSSNQSPQSSYQSPQSSYQSPQSSYQSPQSTYESPEVNYVLPSGDFSESYTTSTSAPFSTGLSDVIWDLRTSFDNKVLDMGDFVKLSLSKGVNSIKKLLTSAASKVLPTDSSLYLPESSDSSNTYAVPIDESESSYNAPTSDLSNSYNAPSSSYNAPSTSYNAPSSSYSAPSSSYNAPSSSYNAPSSSYNAPSSSYNAPSTSYDAPSSSYNPPTSNISPSQTFIFPSSNVGPTSYSSSTSQSFGSSNNIPPSEADLFSSQFAPSLPIPTNTLTPTFHEKPSSAFQDTFGTVQSSNLRVPDSSDVTFHEASNSIDFSPIHDASNLRVIQPSEDLHFVTPQFDFQSSNDISPIKHDISPTHSEVVNKPLFAEDVAHFFDENPQPLMAHTAFSTTSFSGSSATTTTTTITNPSQSDIASRPIVFFDITVDGIPAGTVFIELFNETVPKTAENFRALATGERGLSYTGTRFHRVLPGLIVQGGDIQNGDGTGQVSIYGETFADESFDIPHDSPGLVSMANEGPDSNGSQFFITLSKLDKLNGKNVVFGRVFDETSFRLIETLNYEYGSEDGFPKADIIITNSGEFDRINQTKGK